MEGSVHGCLITYGTTNQLGYNLPPTFAKSILLLFLDSWDMCKRRQILSFDVQSRDLTSFQSLFSLTKIRRIGSAQDCHFSKISIKTHISGMIYSYIYSFKIKRCKNKLLKQIQHKIIFQKRGHLTYFDENSKF